MHEDARRAVGQSLLNLRPTREHFYSSRQFRQTDDAPVGGQVGDVHLAGEGKQMMFTNAVKLDSRNGDDLIAGLGEGALKMRRRILAQASEDLAIGPCHALRSFTQAFAVRVFADGQQDLANGSFDPRPIYIRRCRLNRSI